MFSFSKTGCHTKFKEPSFPYYLLIAEGRIIGLIDFSVMLALCEMQSPMAKIWTWVPVSISHDSKRYNKSTS